MRSFRSVFVLVAALSFTAACASPTDDGATTGDDANLTQISAADVKVEGTAVELGTSRKFVATPKDKVRIHAIPFAGSVGDAVDAQSHSTWGGTLYVLKKVGSGYAVVSSTKADARKTGDLTVTLKTAGSFFIGFEAKAPQSAAKTASSTVTLKLGGTAPATDSSFLGKMKSAYEDGNAEDDFTAIDESKLPAAPKKDWDKLNKTWGGDYPPTASTWTFEGKKIYIVEEDNDGGMSINFYDDKGKYLAGGSASESGTFQW